MACPFFIPVELMDLGPWIHPPRLPLGDPYRGVCTARSTEASFEPPEIEQRDLCNCGYARGRCDRFPDGDAADAVRFSVANHTNGKVRIVYILEKNHAPHGHGVLDFPVKNVPVNPGAGNDPVLARQARAFVKSYLRRVEGAL